MSGQPELLNLSDHRADFGSGGALFHDDDHFAPLLLKVESGTMMSCLLYTSDAADERSSVDLGGRRIIKKKNNIYNHGRWQIERTKRKEIIMGETQHRRRRGHNQKK